MYSFAGGGLPSHIHSMAIATFENQTASPDIPKELYDEMRRELQRRLGATIIYVTHDQSEAMTMSDRVAVMLAGRLQQVAPPRQLYDDPETLQVAEFVGSPKINVLPVANDKAGGFHAVRPEAMEVVAPDAAGAIVGRIRLVEHLGAHSAMILRNHGLLVCAPSIPQAFNLIYWLEQACRIQVQTLTCQRPLHHAGDEVVVRTADALSGMEITLDNEALTNPNVKPDAQKAGSGYGLLEWPALLRALDRQDDSYRN
jgi:hypothetical protein